MPFIVTDVKRCPITTYVTLPMRVGTESTTTVCVKESVPTTVTVVETVSTALDWSTTTVLPYAVGKLVKADDERYPTFGAVTGD